jgi:putative SOS response-associated peptidase YedK
MTADQRRGGLNLTAALIVLIVAVLYSGWRDGHRVGNAGRLHSLVIPASGYYEWLDTPDGKQPHYFTRTDGQVISFAGLWDEWKDRATGETLKSCTMIITEPNALVAEVHDRMQVVLELDQFTPWLENKAGLEFLAPAADGVLQRWPVSKRVNSSKAPKDDETLTQPIAARLATELYGPASD